MVPWRSLNVVEWAVRVIQGMYSSTRSNDRLNGQYSEKFSVGDGEHQGSVLIQLLFILGLGGLLHEFCTGVTWELLRDYDLVLIMDTREECIPKLKVCKTSMESKGLCVNTKKTKCGPWCSQEIQQYPWIGYRSGIDNNSESLQCKLWSTRGAVASLIDWWPTQGTFAQV